MGGAYLIYVLLLLAVGICVLVRRLLVTGQDVREPPLAPEWIPILGHLRGLLKERYEFYPRISKQMTESIFTLNIPGQKMYIVTSPDLIAKVQKAYNTLSFSPIRAKFSNIVFDTSPIARDLTLQNMDQKEGDWGLAYDSHRAFARGLKPGYELDQMSRSMLQRVANSLDRRQPAAGTTGTLDLSAWLREILTAAATEAIYGPQNPFRDPSVVDAFWKFEHNMMSLLLMPMPRVFARSAVLAREKLTAALDRYFTTGGLDTASFYTRTHIDAWKRNGVPQIDVARYEIGGVNAALTNTVPASFWMMMHIFSNPALLVEIRREIDAVTITDERDDGRVIRTLNVTSLKKECPLLVSTFQETLRLSAIGTSVREVLQDTFFDNKWLLKKGALVQMPIRCIHKDSSLWGADVDTFNPRRFLKGEKQQTANGKRPSDVCFRTFGGGNHLCPGRHFATNEVLAVTSLFVARYDVTPASGEWTFPSTLKTNAAATLMEPDTDVRVNVRQRKDYEDGSWTITLTADDKPFAMVAEDLVADVTV